MPDPTTLLTEALAELAKVEVKPRSPWSTAALATGKARVREARAQLEAPGPIGIPVQATFAADHETGDLSEYGATSIFYGSLGLYSGGYGSSGHCLKASVTGPDGYARGHAITAQTGWRVGQDVRWGGAIYLEPGFYAAKQGQIDLFRWDNFEQDSVRTERGGLVFHGDGRSLRLVRIRESEPDEQATLILGPETPEGRWNWVEVRQRLSPQDGEAVNELWLNGSRVGASSQRNCIRADLIVSRYRVGLAATSSRQTKPITVLVDRIRSGPLPLIGA